MITKWTTVSRNERAISIDNRHFFASRCNPSTLWTIAEWDRPGSGALFVRYIARKLTTRDVTSYFKRNPLNGN